MKTKNKNKKIIGVLSMFVFVLCMAIGITFAAPLTASAATYTTPIYTTYGTTTVDGASSGGAPSNFKIKMHGSSTSGTGTMYHDKLIDWSYVYIKIETAQISNHVSFKLMRNGYTYTSKSLSGNGNMTLYAGSLSDGEYELTYVGNYKKNIFSGTTTFTYTYRFEVDKTAPSYTLKAGGSTVSSGSYTNKQIVYTASDTNFDAIRYLRPSASGYSTTYSTSYTVSATDSNNGWWYFYARDDMSTTNSTVSVYLDTIKPVGKVTSNGSTVSNGGYTNKSFYYTATDTGGVSYLQYKKPNSSSWTTYTSGTSISGTNGWYTFRAVDKAGNISDEYKVCYDTAIPSTSLYSGTSTVSSGYYSGADYVKFVTSDSMSGISTAYVKMPNSSYYTTYTSGSQLTAEGTYTFYAVDKAGNTTAYYTITLDKTQPAGTLYAGTNSVTSGTFTNASYVRFVPTDSVSGVSSIYVKKPGASSYTTYSSGTYLYDVGKYEFYAIDRSGNRSATYSVTIDRSIPAAQLYVDGNPVSNGGYTNGGHIYFDSSDTNLRGCYVKLPDSTEFISYAIGTEFYKPGKYTFYAVDEAGQSTGYYLVVIDRTAKPLTFNNVVDGVTDGNVTVTWVNGDPDVFAPVKTVTVNGVSYANGAVIRTIDTGKYEVVCTDAAGNVWSGEFSATTVNVATQTVQQEYWESTDVNGEAFAFENYDNAFAFACEREKTYIRTGVWNNTAWDTGIPMDEKDAVNAVNGTYFIYKKSGDPKTEVAYFTEERLNEVIAEYAKIGIESYFYWEKAHATVGENQNLYRYSDEKTILANAITFNEGVTFTVDGEIVNGLVYDIEGVHELIVSDAYGNECVYTLIVVRDVPEIEYALGDGGKNTVVFDREYRFIDRVTVSIYDEFDEMAMFYVYDDAENLLSMRKGDETYLLDKSGKYTVQAVNHAGKSEVFVLYISLDTPSVSFTENAGDKRLEIAVTDSEDKYSGLQTITVLKSTDGGESWVTLESDDYGKTISLESLSYRFRTSGLYKVVLTDEFRTGIDAVVATFEYTQPEPVGILTGAENGGFTNTDASFSWGDEAVVTVTKDGEEIPYVSGMNLTENGAYTITFENYDGYTATYSFIIDKTAPGIALGGCDNGSVTNSDVIVTADETEITVRLYKDDVLVEDYEVGTAFTESGNYRVVATDKAGNVTEFGFKIDKLVAFTADIYDNAIVNEMTFTAGEPLTITLTKNGETIAYVSGDKIAEPGEYTVTLCDALGNAKSFTFKIVTPLGQDFFHNFDNIDGFEKVLVNGADTRLNYGDLTIRESGEYEITVVVNGKEYPFTVTVDSTAPTAVLNGVENGGETKDGVIIDSVSEKATVELFFEGNKIDYTLGDELTEVGKYRLVLTDEVGNVSEYEFEILYSMNGGTIALIVIGILALIGIVVGVVLGKRAVYKKKHTAEQSDEEPEDANDDDPNEENEQDE